MTHLFHFLPCLRATTAFVFVSVCVLTIPACTRQEEISRYEEPKEATSQSIQKPPSTKGPAAQSPTIDATAPAVTAGSGLTYATPDGWVQGKAGGMRKAAFYVEDGGHRVDVTVIDLAATAGELLPNVNRWRQQLQLGALTEEQLKKTVQRVEIAGVEGHYVELIGPKGPASGKAILAAVAIVGDKAWFFKLWGDADSALRQKDRFMDFIKSVKFQAPDEAKAD